MHQDDRIHIEVVYALPEEQCMLALEVHRGTTVAQAIEQSGILKRFPSVHLASARLGIFGKIADLEAELQDGDRIEIYRPLTADPKLARRQRAKKARKDAGT